MARPGGKIQPMIGGKSAIKPNGGSGAVSGTRAGKTRKSKGGTKTLKTISGKSGIMNPPKGGGYGA